MRFFKTLFLILFLAGIYNVSLAQSKKNTKKSISKFKPPKLISTLSNYKDSAIVTGGEAENIVALPLMVTDDKKNIYAIASYQFLYQKNVVTENEETGKVSATTSTFADRFKASPLPEQWINKVREEIKTGEILYFFDIIVKDAQGRVMYAPPVKITIQ